MALHRWKNTIYCPYCGSSWHFTHGYSEGDKCPRVGCQSHTKPLVRRSVDVANEFSKVLRELLTEREMSRVIARNATEDNPGVCHSHDFCDANMVMLEAFGNLNLPAPCDLTDDTPEHEAACRLWSGAWVIAQKNQFQVVGDGRTFTCSWIKKDLI